MGRAYRAFISYSHRDEKFVGWLHQRLEAWRVPSDLVGRKTDFGEVPARLRPIFRDRDDFSGGSSLRDATLEALRASEALIVVCSPHAARSAYVDEEIRLFKSFGRSNRVFPIIVSGTPGGADDECFPSWLRREPDPQGADAGLVVEPIGADAREVGDGPRRALVKLVAGLLGLPLDEILRREERARRSRIALLAGAAAGAVTFATAFSAYALYQSYQAGLAIEKSVFSIGGLLQTTDRLPAEGELGETRRAMIREQCDLMDGLAGGRTEIGLKESGICFLERSAGLYGERPAGLLKALCGWRDGLLAKVSPKERPSFEEADALAYALERTYRGIAASPDAAGNCTPGGALADHAAFAVESLAALGTKRPDIDTVRVAHEEIVWALIALKEADQFWKDGETIMQAAADLRSLQMKELSAAPRAPAPAEFQYGVFVRRLSWLKAAHLADLAGAERYGAMAVGHWEPLHQAYRDDIRVAYQTILAYEVHGSALADLGRTDEARDRLSLAAEKLREVLARLPADDQSGWRGDLEGELGYVTGRLATLPVD